MPLEVIFGNKTVKNILFFLLVNGKAYGTQIQKQLRIPLTPIQKTFARLEKGELIASYYEGKTRLYHINPHYPLADELEILLKKGFSILPSQEKRQYYALKNKAEKKEPHKDSTLLLFWNRLKNIKQLQFHAHSKAKTENGWNGKGLGEVIMPVKAKKIPAIIIITLLLSTILRLAVEEATK